MKESRFTIDFFELMFLAEACIPPTPIARSMFWDDMINKYYNQMADEERERAFDWIQKNGYFDIENKPKCRLFYDRYNPDNQYRVTTNYEGKIEEKDTFLHKGRYHTNERTSILEEYITKVKKK